MRKSIITTLVISLVCLLVGGVLIGVSLYQMTNPFVYSYDMADGFFSYTMKYASSYAPNTMYYQHLFQLGELLFLSAVILASAGLVAHVIDSRRRVAHVNAPKAQKCEPIDIPVMDEKADADGAKPENN